MEIKNEINSKIDWHTGGEGKHSETETILQARKHYFNMLTRLVTELSLLKGADKIMKKYNVHLVNVDDISRVNIDEPKGD